MRQRPLRAALAGVLTAGLCLLGSATGAQTAQAADFPGNPTTKEGYTLDFQEEFDGTTLDTNKWLPYYLPTGHPPGRTPRPVTRSRTAC